MKITRRAFVSSINTQEYLEAMEWADRYGLTNLDPKSVAVRDFFVEHQRN